jgi:peptidoglycan/LPS O-acetylase OafA/YrhL
VPVVTAVDRARPEIGAPGEGLTAEGDGGLYRRRYIGAFDGLRAVLVLGVLLYHFTGARLPIATGEVAVIAFFSLSGFLITFLLADEHRETGTIRLHAFFRRRALRLSPPMLVLLALWTVVALVFGHDSWITAVPGGGAGGPIHPLTVAETVGAALAYVTNWLNALLQFNLWVGYSPLGHLWSLAVEEQFYIVWAPVMLLFCRLRRTGWWITLLAAGFFIEPVLLYAQGTNRVYFGTDTRMCALLVGAALGWWWRSGRLARLERSAVTPLLGLCSLAGLLVAGIGFRVPDVGWEWVGGLLLASLSGGGLVLYLANRDDEAPVTRLLTRRWMVWLGQRSYAVYLWGYVCNTWFRSLGPACPLLTLLCTLGMAECSYRLVERPLRNWMRLARPRPALPRVVLGLPPVPALAEG